MEELIPHSRPMLSSIEAQAIGLVLQSGMLIGGSRRSIFAEELSALVGKDTAPRLFSSGRMALKAALQALCLPTGSGVLVQSYVCNAVIWAIGEAGYQPVLCDIGEGWVPERKEIEAAVNPSCRALVLAPPFGFTQSARAFREFELPIVHDLCQASPYSLLGMKRDDVGDIAIFSFHPTKYLCAGGGGAAIDFSGSYQETLRALESEYAEPSPFTDLQAAIGSAQIGRIEELRRRRVTVAQSYLSRAPQSASKRLLRHLDTELADMFRLPFDLARGEAKDLFQPFARAGVIARHGVDQLAHRLLGQADKGFPNSVRAYAKTISLPFYPALTDDEARQVSDAIAEIL